MAAVQPMPRRVQPASEVIRNNRPQSRPQPLPEPEPEPEAETEPEPSDQAIAALGGGARAILHAGPPVGGGFRAMCGPMRGAIVGAILLEGWAADTEAAEV